MLRNDAFAPHNHTHNLTFWLEHRLERLAQLNSVLCITTHHAKSDLVRAKQHAIMRIVSFGLPPYDGGQTCTSLCRKLRSRRNGLQ